MQPAGAAGKHAAEARKLQRKNGQSEPAAALYLATSRLQRPETDEAPERSAETRQRLRREVDVLRATAAAKYGDSSFQDAGRRRATCGGNPPTVLWDKVIKHDHSFQQAAQGITFHFRGAPSEDVIVVEHNEFAQGNAKCSHDNLTTLSDCSDLKTVIIEEVYQSNPDGDGSTHIFYALPRNATGYYISADGGKTFSRVDVPYAWDRLKPHPTVGGLLLASTVVEVSGDVEIDKVYVVEKADTLKPRVTLLSEDVLIIDWLDDDQATPTVLMTAYKTLPAGDDFDVVLDMYRWSSPFARDGKKVVQHNVYDFEQGSGYVFAFETKRGSNDERRVFVSTDDAQSFAPAIFPGAGRVNSIRVVDASEGMVFAVAQHTVSALRGDFQVIVTTTNSRYTIKAVKPLFSPLISDEIPALPYVEERNPTGCGEASETSIGVGAKNKFVILKRGSCNFIEKLWNAQAAGAAGVVLINTEDNINLLPGAPDDVARPEIPMMIISSSDGSRLLRDVGKVTVMTFFEDNLQLVDLYQHSNLYASDASGIFFSVVLKDVVYAPYQAFYGATEIVDVYKVSSLPGTYLANYEVDLLPRTVVTFNKGSYWQRLPPPEGVICPHSAGASCSLHLSLESSQDLLGLPLPLSEATAEGVILANGFVGDFVDSHIENYTMVISRDGGRNWAQVANTPHLYAILDHGTLLAAASWTRNDGIEVSAQGGASGTWRHLPIVSAGTKEFLYLQTEEGGTTSFLFVYHEEGYVWSGIKLDFKSVLTRLCAAGVDYETWSPGLAAESGGQLCLLGRSYGLDRTNPCKICYKGLDHEGAYEKMVGQETALAPACPCSTLDFHCAPGFYRRDPLDIKSPCVYDHGAKAEVECQPGQKSKTVAVYSAIPGDECDGFDADLSHQKQTIACTSHSSQAVPAGEGFLYAVAAAAVLFVLVVFVFAVSPRARQGAIRVLGTEHGCTGYIGRFLASFACFRRRTTVSFRELRVAPASDDLGPLDSDDEMLLGLDDAYE